ncbi:glutathione S-transferase family protein [Pseudomonas sp. Gutcm_11s]|uniref:glutathione S-transferase family protein n=1 Tax=Pseudomonas sp. Gutcm_11s TaxID=3026088 RepID=UPI00235DDA35|nr:glutathione S-transferase family protein [Pseudomonas sp. Gutcm_11s]MDD0843528.1 glutathione S-transferase family protein [Pseudomonas sp. Gutcm_11s]
MALELFAHPFSSYCQKVLIALYENDTPFEYRLLAPEQPQNMQRLTELWPLRRFPLLLDDGQPVLESSVIIEHLQLRHPGPVRLIPADPIQALEVRLMDRVFDNYISTPQQKCVFDALRQEGERDAYGVSEARRMLDTAYAWLEQRLQGRTWAAGDSFSLADCAAGPFLFYADWTQPIGEAFPTLRAYRQRLLQRPSFTRAVDEARPYRAFFPLGAPDRD